MSNIGKLSRIFVYEDSIRGKHYLRVDFSNDWHFEEMVPKGYAPEQIVNSLRTLADNIEHEAKK